MRENCPKRTLEFYFSSYKIYGWIYDFASEGVALRQIYLPFSSQLHDEEICIYDLATNFHKRSELFSIKRKAISRSI